ncbi:sterol desaturase family protein [Nodosilinea sp. LEGE 07298]|uniref:sterol desaturase family protein n=1 Tax=Nodosilinea sp. LEGE 07298 TaxID=2777970 RepID=UPI00187F5819|nr:sterol desaturase family protein [Nodosilinea sp. LEGE 07298]MBE9111867.1 sterol desaturase family protein [Nodosilinea sp. LEGE 07298]
MKERSFEFYSIALWGIILCRYFLVAGITYWVFYSPVGRAFSRPKRQSPSWPTIWHDIKLSAIAAAVFALAAAFVLSAYHDGATRLYVNPQDYGLWYLGASYAAALVLQDTYFYFTHRLFHHPKLFAWLHQGHHRSRYPTPWTSFAFDPLEAVVQAIFLVGIVFVLPLHIVTVLAVMITMTLWAVLNHLGPDRLPTVFPHHWLGRWVIGPAHHSVHHLRYTLHYGLYFTFWDRLLGTQDPSYVQTLRNYPPNNADNA